MCVAHYYQNRRTGRLRDLRPTDLTAEESLQRFVVKAEGCWTWSGTTNRGGYGTFCAAGTTHLAHRKSWEIANSMRVPAGMVICHRCDNPPCTNPAHLFLGTQSDNCHDMHAKGRARFGVTRGRNNHLAKLCDSDIVDVRTLRALGAREVDLARAYSVTADAIGRIVRRKTWRHVP